MVAVDDDMLSCVWQITDKWSVVCAVMLIVARYVFSVIISCSSSYERSLSAQMSIDFVVSTDVTAYPRASCVCKLVCMIVSLVDSVGFRVHEASLYDWFRLC